jgi:hypothetical protein
LNIADGKFVVAVSYVFNFVYVCSNDCL